MLGMLFRPLGIFILSCTAVVISVQAAGPLTRVPNTSLANLPTTPPVYGYSLSNAFPTVSLSQPVCITSPPGETNRLFILERPGAIVGHHESRKPDAYGVHEPDRLIG